MNKTDTPEVLAVVPMPTAEDEPSMRRYIQTLMSPWDCELAIESTAEGAIRYVKTDVALLGFTWRL